MPLVFSHVSYLTTGPGCPVIVEAPQLNSLKAHFLEVHLQLTIIYLFILLLLIHSLTLVVIAGLQLVPVVPLKVY